MSHTLDFTSEPADGGLPRVGMAPLVDIVLLLICFYLFVMRSIQSHTDEALRLPAVNGQYLQEVLPAELVVNLKASGEIILNGATVGLDALGGILLSEQARAAEQNRRIRVVIRSDARQTYDTLDEVLAACRDANLSDVTLRTRRERDP